VDLAFNDDAAAKLCGDPGGVLAIIGNAPAWHWHTVRGENLFGLVFMQLQITFPQ
jgi:hypothetical protein